MNDIKVVLIDVDNTLLDFKKCSKQAMELSFAQNNVEMKEEIFEYFLKINDELWERLEKGEITKDFLHQNRFKSIFEKFNIKNAPAQKVELEFIEFFSKSDLHVDDALEILKYLSKKYTVHVASNSNHDRQLKRLTSAGMIEYIDTIFASGQIGHLKPSEEFFKTCFEKLDNIEKHQVIIIGDSLTADILGGKNFGIKTCWFDKDNKSIKREEMADFTINRLIDVKKIL